MKEDGSCWLHFFYGPLNGYDQIFKKNEDNWIIKLSVHDKDRLKIPITNLDKAN